MNKEKILVIDDDVHIRDFLQDALEQQNFEVVTTDNGESGISLFKKQPFDLVFVDMKLPQLNGIEVLKMLKKHTSKIPVVIITGHGSIENAVESMKQGAYNYLTKPLTLETLTKVIEKAKENQKTLNEGSRELETINVNGIRCDPGFITF